MSSLLEFVQANENAKEREIITNVIITDITKLTSVAYVPAREGDVIKEEVDGIVKEYQLTKETAIGKKIPMNRYSISFDKATKEVVNDEVKEVVKSYQFVVLRGALPTNFDDYINRKANVILVKDVLPEARANVNNPNVVHPAGKVFINCVKVTFVNSKEEDMLQMFAKLLANRPTM